MPVKPLWAPSPKQAEFMQSIAFETLFGGAAGGGKTEALIYGALGLNYQLPNGKLCRAIDEPKYWALLIRRNSVDLKPLEERCAAAYTELIPEVKHNRQQHTFVFPSGARIELTHGDSEDVIRNKYKGGEYQYAGFEELTEHPTDAAYTYLLTRMRRASGMTEGFPVFVRATTNPDGPGNDWVKERWRIPDEGTSVPTFRERGRTREFIRARVWDNPHLDPEYEGTLRIQSEQRVRALLEGRWDVVDIEGAIYGAQYRWAAVNGRFTDVPLAFNVPVNTFWDIGLNDAMAIWFHQRVGLQDRFIDYFEARHQPLEYYARALKNRDYLYGEHYLPHDAAKRQIGAYENKTTEQLLQDLGVKPTRIVERVNSVVHGIEITRQAWASCYFDKMHCEQGLKCLKHYRYKISPETGTAMRMPHHDWASNGADAFRQFAQGFRGARMTWQQYKEEAERKPYGYKRKLKKLSPESKRKRNIYG